MQSLREYQTFNSITEMDEAAAIQIKRHAADLNETDRKLLHVIQGYSCKVPGVSYLKMATLAQTIGISDRQVRRIVKKLADLRILEKIQTYREKSGGKGVNILRILPIDPAAAEANVISQCHIEDKPQTQSQQATAATSKKESHYIQNSLSSLHIRNGGDGSDSFGSEVLKGSIPAPIYDVMAPYYGASDMYRIYGILLRAKSSIDRNITLEEWAQEYVQVFKSAVWRLKTGKIRSLDGYLYRSFQSITSWIKRKQAQADGSLATLNWLDDETNSALDELGVY